MTNKSAGVGCACVAQMTLIMLKLFGVISARWIIVLMPIWVSFAMLILLGVVAAIIGCMMKKE